jgi:lipoyl(octanoyl) transferase
VNTDLRYFEYMHPCGIRDKAVTSLAYEAGKLIDLPILKNRLIEHFKDVFVEVAHTEKKELQTL